MKFLVDGMLGRLAKWMCVLGCDAEYFPVMEDGTLVERALAEGRIILTRDTLLVKRRKARENSFLVKGDHLPDQLRQVVRRFAIEPSARLLSRCLLCNRELQGVEKESLLGRVPDYVFRTEEHFHQCPACGRIYWPATHREEITRRLREMGF